MEAVDDTDDKIDEIHISLFKIYVSLARIEISDY